MELIHVVKDHNPQLMSNGQIRMECPFRENHTDGSGEYSMFLTPDINAYHCFSCGAKGNLAKLLNKKFDVNYFEALGMVNTLSLEKPTVKEFELEIVWNKKLPKIFLDRFPKEVLEHFKLGTTDDGWAIIPFYKDGNLVGYQKRKDKPDRIVLNSKGFVKKHYLYNYDDSYEYVVGVEGYSDVMRLFQYGYNATGLLGADASSYQAEQMAKFKRVYLAYDNDFAGRRATEIVYHQIKNNTDVRFVPYPTKDPDKCSKREWVRAFKNSTDYLEYTLAMMELEYYEEMKEQVIKELKERRLRDV